MGELITETFPFDGGRKVSIYVPARPVDFVLYCGDGQLLAPWGADLVVAAEAATIIVGVHRLADETRRLHEYSAGFDPARFDAHASFVVNELRSWVNKTFALHSSRETTLVYGVSASAEFALAMGAKHPDVFAAVFAASPGAGYHPPGELIHAMPPTYLAAGLQEPFFLDNAARWEVALREAGRRVTLETRDAGHDETMWRAELPRMLAWVTSQPG